jgi:hypothetical protein
MSTSRRPVSAPFRLAALPAFALLSLLSACSGRYDVAMRGDGAADVSFSASLEPQTARLIVNLSGLGGDAPSAGPLIDAAALARSLKAAPGAASAALRNPDARSVGGTVSIGDLDRFLATPAGGAKSADRFIRVERSSSGGRLAVSLDRASGPSLLANLSADVADYVSALMAPIATGEELTRAQYLDLVASTYGKGIAAEIAGSTVRASIELPGPATAARGGTFAGRRVEFSLPLVDLLVLERPILLEASWK